MNARFNAKACSAVLLGVLLLLPRPSLAASSGCSDIFVALGQGPGNVAGAHLLLTAALTQATLPLGSGTTNGGFGLNMWASIVDRDGRVGIDYGVYGVPETFVVDKQGVIRYKQIGPITVEALEKKILPLVRDLQKS